MALPNLNPTGRNLPTIPTMVPQAEKVTNQALNRLEEFTANPYGGLAPILQQHRENYLTQTAPGVEEALTKLGVGPSAGPREYARAAGAASLERQLAGLQSQHMLQSLPLLANIGFQNQFAYLPEPEEKESTLSKFATNVGGAGIEALIRYAPALFGAYIGGPFGTALASAGAAKGGSDIMDIIAKYFGQKPPSQPAQQPQPFAYTQTPSPSRIGLESLLGQQQNLLPQNTSSTSTIADFFSKLLREKEDKEHYEELLRQLAPAQKFAPQLQINPMRQSSPSLMGLQSLGVY